MSFLMYFLCAVYTVALGLFLCLELNSRLKFIALFFLKKNQRIYLKRYDFTRVYDEKCRNLFTLLVKLSFSSTVE